MMTLPLRVSALPARPLSRRSPDLSTATRWLWSLSVDMASPPAGPMRPACLGGGQKPRRARPALGGGGRADSDQSRQRHAVARSAAVRRCGLGALDRASCVRAGQLVAHPAHVLAREQVVGDRLEHRAGGVGQRAHLLVVERAHRPLEHVAARGRARRAPRLAVAGEGEQLGASVLAGDALDEAVALEPVDQLHGARVRDAQSGGEEGDRPVGVPEQRHQGGGRVRAVPRRASPLRCRRGPRS